MLKPSITAGRDMRVAKGVLAGVVVAAALVMILLVGGSGGAAAAGASGQSPSDAAELPVTISQLAQLPIIAGFVAAMWFFVRALSSGRKLQ